MSEQKHIGRAPYNTPTDLVIVPLPIDSETIEIGTLFSLVDVQRMDGVARIKNKPEFGDPGDEWFLDPKQTGELIEVLTRLKAECEQWRREHGK